MKWVGAGVILLTCFTAAACIYRQAQGKVKFYTGLIAFCHHLHTEIGFALIPLGQIIAQYHATSPELNQVLTGYLALLASKADITREKCLALTTDAEVAEFLFNLGRTGYQEEKHKIETALVIFTEKKTQAQTYLQSKASIICKLLIIIGIAGVILWI